MEMHPWSSSRLPSAVQNPSERYMRLSNQNGPLIYSTSPVVNRTMEFCFSGSAVCVNSLPSTPFKSSLSVNTLKQKPEIFSGNIPHHPVLLLNFHDSGSVIQVTRLTDCPLQHADIHLTNKNRSNLHG